MIISHIFMSIAQAAEELTPVAAVASGGDSPILAGLVGLGLGFLAGHLMATHPLWWPAIAGKLRQGTAGLAERLAKRSAPAAPTPTAAEPAAFTSGLPEPAKPPAGPVAPADISKPPWLR